MRQEIVTLDFHTHPRYLPQDKLPKEMLKLAGIIKFLLNHLGKLHKDIQLPIDPKRTISECIGPALKRLTEFLFLSLFSVFQLTGDLSGRFGSMRLCLGHAPLHTYLPSASTLIIVGEKVLHRQYFVSYNQIKYTSYWSTPPNCVCVCVHSQIVTPSILQNAVLPSLKSSCLEPHKSHCHCQGI